MLQSRTNALQAFQAKEQMHLHQQALKSAYAQVATKVAGSMTTHIPELLGNAVIPIHR